MSTRLSDRHQTHARVIQSVFMHIATSRRERDESSLRRLRLRPDQLERLSRMSAVDLLRLGELGEDCLTFDVDPEALDTVFRAIDERRDREDLIEQCIRRDAPRALMEAFFGVSRHRYSKLRVTLGMAGTAGRYARPSSSIEQAIYERWVAWGRPWSAQCLLEIADGLDLSLRVVWDHLVRLNEPGP